MNTLALSFSRVLVLRENPYEFHLHCISAQQVGVTCLRFSCQLQPPSGRDLCTSATSVALSYGADDLHGTIIEKHLFHMGGATAPQLQTEMEMVKAIHETRCTPV